MIVYSETKRTFILDTLSNSISSTIENLYVRETGYKANKSEVASWSNSMQFMKNILEDNEIPDDTGIAIEYKIPQTSKRIDFIITGADDNKRTAILIELKQWSEGISISPKDAVVNAAFYGRETNHPSYQAWSYASLLNDYNSAVQDKGINLEPCAYLHNYSKENGAIDDSFYAEWTEKAPVFFREDFFKLRDFIKRFVKYGDQGTLMYEIDHGKIRPSKSLADSLHSMLKGNKEFTLIDTQKIVYETVLNLAKREDDHTKHVVVVKGGPGTGKSVVAINLLAEITREGLVTQYVTRNSAPREVFQVMLTGKFTKSRISNLFTSSGSFTEVESNTFDALIIDEAQRLNEKSGLFNNKGENQIKELISSSKTSVFFIDEDQRVTLKDIGEIGLIKQWAEAYEADYHEYELESQFRCNGSDGYLAWLDDSLQIHETANTVIGDIGYDFKVLDSPQEVFDVIKSKNRLNNKSRMVAGYCWDWVSKKDSSAMDIVIGDFSAQWNLAHQGQAWIVHPESVSEIGCVHTCQGLELDYVGVIIGNDLVARDGKLFADASKRAKTDKSMFGFKKMSKEDPGLADAMEDLIIKNTYRVLMSRGMKGCYIYCTDPETQEYFKRKLSIEHE
jgi:DUF2075 family protein